MPLRGGGGVGNENQCKAYHNSLFPLKNKSTDKRLFVSLDRQKSPPEGCTEEIDSNYVKGLGKVFLKKSAVS